MSSCIRFDMKSLLSDMNYLVDILTILQRNLDEHALSQIKVVLENVKASMFLQELSSYRKQAHRPSKKSWWFHTVCHNILGLQVSAGPQTTACPSLDRAGLRFDHFVKMKQVSTDLWISPASWCFLFSYTLIETTFKKVGRCCNH